LNTSTVSSAATRDAAALSYADNQMGHILDTIEAQGELNTGRVGLMLTLLSS
jgi:hypothetical protein